MEKVSNPNIYKNETNKNRRLKFAIHTLGCKVNQYESEQIIENLLKTGWEQVDFTSSDADAYIINTCSVTAIAGHKSRQLIRRAVNNNTKGMIVVTGCYANSDKNEIESILREINGSSLIVSNEEKSQLPVLINNKIVHNKSDAFEALEGTEAFLINEKKIEPNKNINNKLIRTRPFVKIQDGCNNFCSYCIVPYVRGSLRSRPIDDVAEEVNHLVELGAKEIVLTGIHLGLYGHGEDTSLAQLIEKLIKIKDLGRIRLSSIEINEVTPQLVDLIVESGKLCNHLHIPLQSGSNTVLERMNRHYTKEEFIEKTKELKKKVKDIALTTDVIVGFPGESDDDFSDTIETIKAIGFSSLHVFKYSPRKGTPAASFNGQISNKVKDERSDILINLRNKLAMEFASNFVGKKLNVLVERKFGGKLETLSDNYLRVYIDGEENLIGTIRDVKVERMQNGRLHGRLIG